MDPSEPRGSADVLTDRGWKAATLAYQQVTTSHRSISEFRAKLLGLLPLASGAAAGLLLRDSAELQAANLAAIGVFGVVVTLGLFMYELRLIQLCQHLRCRASKLEELLGLEETGEFFSRPQARVGEVVGAEGAGWIVYTTVIVSWVFVAGSGISLWTDGRWLALVALEAVVLLVRFVVIASAEDDDCLRSRSKPSTRAPW